MRFKSSLRVAPADFKPENIPYLRLVHTQDLSTLERQSQKINSSSLKRALDICLSSGMILFLLPALLVIAALIKITSPGPILFRQQRYGAGGRKFWILKFRTMRVLEAHGAFRQASRRDARVTPIGAWLRRSSMDELPQLFNVLAGSMSLVGPRPHAVAMDDYFGAFIPDFHARHLVRPGVTGLAQITGYRGPTEDIEAIAGRVGCDISYIRSWSPATDILILLRTPGALFGRNAF
ncbi:MAG TPA: sugar transferase [Hyphomicrobiales bacterium]|jgi:putative colanic acid biosynthesis UDP-glucose lipid carrier transferase